MGDIGLSYLRGISKLIHLDISGFVRIYILMNTITKCFTNIYIYKPGSYIMYIDILNNIMYIKLHYKYRKKIGKYK